MTNLQTAAQQALEAWDTRAGIDTASRAFEALRAALAQHAEPVEPVAWIYQNMYTEQEYLVWKKGTGGRNWTPLYAAPPRCPNCASLEAQNTELDRKLAELEQAETAQEPVAWLYEAGADRTLHWHKPPLYGTPLYTAPPQRLPLAEWQINDLMAGIDPEDVCSWSFRQGVYAAEKHHGVKP